MGTKEKLLKTLGEVLGVLQFQIRLGNNDSDDIVRLSSEIRRVVLLIAEIDHE